MKKLTSIIFVPLFILCGCAHETESLTSSESLSDETSSSVIESKYVKGQRIYDIAYEPDGYIDETLSLEEFPELSFVRSDNKHELYIEGREKILVDSQKIGAKGIYLTDINNDGYTDLAYYQDRRKASSNTSYLVRIYDYHNDIFLFNDDNGKRSILDLDDEGTLLIEELDNAHSSSFDELERAGRFLKGESISFEWFTFESKLKSIYIQESAPFTHEMNATINKTKMMSLYLVGIGDEKLEKAVPFESINITQNSDYYSFEIRNSAVASIFYINFNFLKVGKVTIDFSIGDVKTDVVVNITEQNNIVKTSHLWGFFHACVFLVYIYKNKYYNKGAYTYERRNIQ